MKKLLLPAAALVVIAFMLVPGVLSVSGALPAGAESVSGRVTNEAGQPLAGVRVEFRHGTESSVVFTNSGGVYAITGIAAGSYIVTATRSGFETETTAFDVQPLGVGQPGPDFTMRSDRSELLFGMDLPHTLMTVALILGVVVIVLSTIYVVHLKRRRDEMEGSGP